MTSENTNQQQKGEKSQKSSHPTTAIHSLVVHVKILTLGGITLKKKVGIMARLPQANIIRQLVVRIRARRPVRRRLISHINTVRLGELGFLPGGVGDLESGGSAFSVTFVDRRAAAAVITDAVTTTNAINTFEGQDYVAISTTKVMDVES